ncbi:hypothetical protein HDC90_001110 [Pedobacter sp. AK013]|uniref:hypothetical protein n=1 Tax=Pedobacter sp. AK013 TaxID=2723071 RepID=UPI001617C7FA|nr:hypothetical protein [Pedobacter sp. AK013]MBB6236498.1 hypothetical protein [Pedobacter sp. AK013]
MQTINQRNATRNQSTADFEVKRIFIFDNRFERGVFKNTTGGSFTLQAGMLVVRDTAVTGGLLPATALNFQDAIGIAAMEEDVVLANNETVNIMYGTKGTVDGLKLVLPATVTLNSVATGDTKTLGDLLNGLGLHLDLTTVENTKFDN